MVSIETVRASNAGLRSLGPGLVAVFVGGTSGIGESTAREWVRNTDAAKCYIVGRNQEQANRIQQELKALNPGAEINFVSSDLTLLKNVDKACDEIRAKEDKVNLLFMSPGYLTWAGRNESIEGLDKKLNLNYYSRLRFTHNLLPLLEKAAESGSLSRNVSVLSAGSEGVMNLDDLALKKNFSGLNCLRHATTMNSLMTSYLATLHPGTSFIHTYPGGVKTNITQGFGRLAGLINLFYPLLKPFLVPLQESGERHLYAATDSAFAPKTQGGDGGYLLNWNDEPTGKVKLLNEYREQGIAEKVWQHTLDVYKTVCNNGKTW